MGTQTNGTNNNDNDVTDEEIELKRMRDAVQGKHDGMTFVVHAETVYYAGNDENNSREDDGATRTAYTGIVYSRDPYEAGSNQNIDSRSSDLDTEENIIPGGLIMLTSEEFMK